MDNHPNRTEDSGIESHKPTSRPRRIKLINSGAQPPDASKSLMPLSACDCDNHCEVHCIVGDIPVCGVWG